MSVDPERTEISADPESWLDEYGDALFCFALARVTDRHAAEDLVQETLISAVKSVHTFSGRSQVKTWLIGILRRRIADYFHRTRRMPKVDSTDMDGLEDTEFSSRYSELYYPAVSVNEFQSSLEKEEFWQVVQECVSVLPVHLQEAFVARLANDQESVEAICSELDVTKNNFSVRLYRARLLLRQCFERYWLAEDDV